MTSQGAPEAGAKWRYEILHGPDGEADYAWVYAGSTMVGTFKTHHAIEVVDAMNRRAPTDEDPTTPEAQAGSEAMWLDISTAPKDGTRVLLGKIVGHPDHPTALWWATMGFWSDKWKNWNDGFEPSGLAGPTHWMRLTAHGALPTGPTSPPDATYWKGAYERMAARNVELAAAGAWQPVKTAPRDGRYVWLWNKQAEHPADAPQRYRWSTHYSIFGLGGCWTDGLCTMGDGVDFDFWCESLPANFVNPHNLATLNEAQSAGKE